MSWIFFVFKKLRKKSLNYLKLNIYNKFIIFENLITRNNNKISIFLKRYNQDFPSKLIALDFETLEKSSHSIYGLSKDLELIYINPGWIRFANENGGGISTLNEYPIGTSIINTMDESKIKAFYIENYTNVLKTGKVWNHKYECSSKDESRIFNQRTYRLKNGDGLIVINSLLVKLPMKSIDRKAYQAVEENYLHTTGLITQCCNCKNTQRAKQPNIWDWVPAWIKNIPSNMSHSICPICYDYYWKNI